MKIKNCLIAILASLSISGYAQEKPSDFPLSVELFSKAVYKSKDKFNTEAGVKLLIDGKSENLEGVAELEVSQKNFLAKANDLDPKIAITKAYIGFIPFNSPSMEAGIKIGKYPSYEAFSSKIQFDSSLEGILAYWKTKEGEWSTPYIKGGIFLTNGNFFGKDSSFKNYNWIGEIGLENINQSGAYASFSTQSWNVKKKKHPTSAYDFLILEGRIGHKCKILEGTPVNNFVGMLLNVKEKFKENAALYAGTSIGCDNKKGDVLIEGLYKVIYPKALPLCDQQGIKDRGNYMGPVLKAKYMINDKWSIQAKFERAQRFKKVEEEFTINRGEIKTSYIF